MWFIVGLISFGIASFATSAGTSPKAVDPIFGLTYAPEKIHFDAAPKDLLSTCPALANEHWSRRLWTYAEDRTKDGTYLVVGGFYASRPPAPAKLTTDPKGAIIEITSSGCTLIGPAREVFQYPEGLVPPTVLNALAADLVRRYRAAFGGTKALQAALTAQHIQLTGSRDAILRDALAAAQGTQ